MALEPGFVCSFGLLPAPTIRNVHPLPPHLPQPQYALKNYGSSGATSGLSSSLAFTPIQGIELVNPNQARAGDWAVGVLAAASCMQLMQCALLLHHVPAAALLHLPACWHHAPHTPSLSNQPAAAPAAPTLSLPQAAQDDRMRDGTESYFSEYSGFRSSRTGAK